MAIEKLNLSFNDNTVISIYGQNGSGKSTLVYAIAFAITGFRYGESYRDYVSTGKDLAKVILDAELNGEPIHYDIEVKGRNKSGSPIKRIVTYKGKEYLNSDYSQFMKEYDLDTIEHLMFLFQNNKDIIEAKPAERSNMLRKLLQFEFDDIVGILKEESEESKSELLEMNAVLKELNSQVFECVPLQREVIPQAITAWEKKLETVKNNLASVENIDASTINKCKNSITSTLNGIKSIEYKISVSKNNIENANKEISRLAESIKNNNQAKYESEITRLNNEIIKHKEDYKKQTQLRQNIINQINLKDYEIKNLDTQISIGKEGICHVCGQAIDEHHLKKLIDRREEVLLEKNNLDGTIKSMNYDPYDRDLSLLEQERDMNIRNKNLYESNVKDLNHIKSSISGFNELLTTQENYLKSLKDTLDSLKAQAKQNEKLIPLLEKKDSLIDEQNTLIQSVQNAKNVIISNQERRKNNEIIKRNMSERDNKVNELNLKSNEISLKLENLKTSTNIFENLFPNYIVLQACKKLEDYINSIVQKLFPYMQVSLKQNRSGVNFYFTVGSCEEELSVCMASGAQKMILSLAYSVALARMYGLNCILIDEADASMTPDNAKLVYDFIASLSDFSQIIFISHREESRDAMRDSGRDNLIFYEVNNGNYNQISC